MPEHEDERLIEDLADRESRPAAPPGPTEPLARIQVDLETLSSRLRTPAPPDPFADEADCHAAVERAVALAEDASQKTFISTPDAGPVASHAGPASPADVSPGILGQYRLIAELGAGGMGTVYKAIHTKLERVVALKVLPAARLQDPHAVSRFEREMRAVGKLQHPNIVAAHDAGEIDGTHYLVMELVEGRDLSAIVKDFHPMPIAAACEMIRQAALGLQHAHQHGLVHRDIKPSNLMLAASNVPGSAPAVKILDLGLALLADGQLEPAPELTSTGQVMGTIDYMAPEQGTDTHKVDIRADIYSLGATLYKLLTGHVPFAGAQYNTAVKKLMALATKEPPAVTSLRPDCPLELASLVQQMLAKSPAERPASPAAVARALQPFAQGADLRPLLTPSETDEWQAPPPGSTARLRNTDASAFDETHVSDLAALPTARLQPAPANRKQRRWLIALAGMGALIASAAVIFVVTETGTVEIEMADGATDKIAVNVLRDGLPVIKDWEIRSTDRESRVRTGKIEVVLTGESADRFEIESPDDLHVSRGGRKIFTVRRRPDSAPGARGRSPDSAETAAGMRSNGTSPTSPPEGSSEFPDPIPVAEPLPLDEWLKGRTLLTVAQDGSGQFATIQAALQALKPGEAVQVLDGGPYRERLVFHPPDDTGLFSKVGTVIELESWVTGWKEALYGHTIHSPHDFRIGGLSFSTPVVPDVADFCLGMLISQSDGFVLENCFLAQPASPKSLLGINWFLDAPVKPCVVRNCVFECRLALNSAFGHSQVILERNLFQSSDVPYHVSVSDAKYDSLVIRHNIFAGRPSNYEVLLNFPNDDASLRVLEFTNNTSLSPAMPGVQRVLPAGDVRILNNLRLRPGLLMFSENAERELPRAIRTWHVGHNAYPRRIKAGDLHSLGDEHIFPTPATDLLGQPGFASVDATHPGYLRIPADSPLATAGAGNKWPAYVGALPPGPAPRDGDWFSKMRQHWLRVAPAPKATPDNRPATLPEPPPVADWLKDRTVLTVSQDGRGEFSTIQAALHALQRRQVIRVLDRGPYRESLRFEDVPDDTGLISDARTRLELATWRGVVGHELGGINGFRLAGFEFGAPPRAEWAALISWGNSPSGLIIEDCHFNPERSGEPAAPLACINIDFATFKPEMSPIWIRRCILNSTVQLFGKSGQNATVVFEENLWYKHQASPYCSAPNLGRVIIRKNLLTTHGPQFVRYENALRQIEVSNNTILGPGSQFLDSLPQSGVTILNNVIDWNVYFLQISEAERDACLGNWHVGWNAFRNYNWHQDVALPPMRSDFAGEPEFLSLNPKHEDYLRIAADSPLANAGAGGEWANHIGALPPGPAPREGDWFTRLRQRWLGYPMEVPTAKAGQSRLPVEPPPLAEWLKGRTILTVSQDGRGQFSTIQGALNALRGGQVIEVLDRGPYRESLRRGDVPHDTGLISHAKTRLEVVTWEGPAGHELGSINGFRLSGFELDAPARADWGAITAWGDSPSGLIIEDCLFKGERVDNPATRMAGMMLDFQGLRLQPTAIWIRHCMMNCTLQIAGPAGQNATIVIEENLFHELPAAPHCSASNLGSLVIRRNMLTTLGPQFDKLPGRHLSIELSNNTVLGTGSQFAFAAPHAGVTIYNNILYSNLLFIEISAAERDACIKAWDFGWNAFYNHNKSPGFGLPRSPTDFAAQPEFLSLDPKHADYLRIAADSPLGTAGAGGEWPKHIGALPPGPAPPGGDWFTRLRERWPAPDRSAGNQPGG